MTNLDPLTKPVQLRLTTLCLPAPLRLVEGMLVMLGMLYCYILRELTCADCPFRRLV